MCTRHISRTVGRSVARSLCVVVHIGTDYYKEIVIVLYAVSATTVHTLHMYSPFPKNTRSCFPVCNCVRRPPQLLNSHQTRSAHSASSYMHAFMHHSNVRNHLIWLRMRLVFHDVPTLALQCEPRRSLARIWMELKQETDANAMPLFFQSEINLCAPRKIVNGKHFFVFGGVWRRVLSSLHLFGKRERASVVHSAFRRRCFCLCLCKCVERRVQFSAGHSCRTEYISVGVVECVCTTHLGKIHLWNRKMLAERRKRNCVNDAINSLFTCSVNFFFFRILYFCFCSLNSCVYDSEVEIKRFLNFFRNAIGRTLIEWALCTWTLCVHTLAPYMVFAHSAHHRTRTVWPMSLFFFFSSSSIGSVPSARKKLLSDAICDTVHHVRWFR